MPIQLDIPGFQDETHLLELGVELGAAALHQVVGEGLEGDVHLLEPLLVATVVVGRGQVEGGDDGGGWDSWLLLLGDE